MSQEDKVMVLETESGREETLKVVNGMKKRNLKEFVKNNRGMIAGFAAMCAAQALYNVTKNHISKDK